MTVDHIFLFDFVNSLQATLIETLELGTPASDTLRAEYLAVSERHIVGAAVQRLAKASGGLSGRVACQLYSSIAIPSMLYAADVFLIPIRTISGNTRATGSVGAIRKLARVQRDALIMILDAMRTTATAVLEAHLNIPPFHLLVDEICQRAATSLCTLPTTHPLYSHVRRAARHFVQRHRSPLHHLLHAYALNPNRHPLEVIQPARFSPSYVSPFKTTYAKDKKAALQDEKKWCQRPGIRVYTDGSDIDGGVGACAAVYVSGRTRIKMLHYHFGPSSSYTVYEAELGWT